jgi:hypothetical protein
MNTPERTSYVLYDEQKVTNMLDQWYILLQALMRSW